MADEPLQRLDFKGSPYHRPNVGWRCGGAEFGRPCVHGPTHRGQCGAGPHCSPQRRGERWQCTRLDVHGGRCDHGPDAEGRCGTVALPCLPRRTLKNRRKYVTAGVSALILSFTFAGLGGSSGAALVSPGALTPPHAAIMECGACHEQDPTRPASWLSAALHGDTARDGDRCLGCHDKGAHPFAPHGVGRLASYATPDELEFRGASLLVRLAAAGNGGGLAQPVCSDCHREHGTIEQLIRTDDELFCHRCHQTRFGGFNNGHPEFDGYPHPRRQRIAFDHGAHLGAHFKEEAVAPFDSGRCATCHRPDAAGREMRVGRFEDMCGACHREKDLRGGGLTVPSVAVLELPELDTDALREHGIGVGQWPAVGGAERLGLLTAYLLAAADPTLGDPRTLAGADLYAMSSAADPQQRARVGAVARGFKILLQELAAQGAPAMIERFARFQPETGAERDAWGGSGLSFEFIEQVSARWFPRLAEEVAAFRAGETVPTSEPPAPPPAPEPAAKDAAPGGQTGFGSGDDPFGGGDADPFGGGPADPFGGAAADPFGGGSADPFAAEDIDGPAPASGGAARALGPAERMRRGGWYSDDNFAVRYRPGMHADRFMQYLIEFAASQGEATYSRLFDANTAGKCLKCHTVDAAGDRLLVNWRPADPDLERMLTPFAHRPHLIGKNLAETCTDCHRLEAGTDAADSHAGFDPGVFQADFGPISQTDCAVCHRPGRAGADCVQCHEYHRPWANAAADARPRPSGG